MTRAVRAGFPLLMKICLLKHRLFIRSISFIMKPFLAGAVLVAALSGAQVKADDTGLIDGRLVDMEGKRVYAGEAAVFIADAATGYPLLRSTRQPVALSFQDLDFNDLWHVVTDERGGFRFQDVPVGRYRLVAQAWSGTKGAITFPSKPSSFVILHGVAEDVVVRNGEATFASVRQMGDDILKIVNDPEEAHAFLFMSREPLLGDPVLAFYGWGDDFVRNIVGVTLMEVPHVTIVGLPTGSRLHVALFNYDNNPGVGGGSYDIGEDRVGEMRIVATWSNGHRDPPEELQPLVDYLVDNPDQLPRLLNVGDDVPDRFDEFRRLLREEPTRKVSVADLGEFRVIDIIAADAYQRIRRDR